MKEDQSWSRYARQLAIPEFGPEGQEKLARGSALVVGAGGLGSPLLFYLAAAGLGRIGIVDGDRVAPSNLHRQSLDGPAKRLRQLNPQVSVEAYPVPLTSQNALELLEPYEVVADGSDNFPTRYLVNDACLLTGKPDVYGAVFRFEGQLSVFNAWDEAGVRGPNYRDLHPEPPAPHSVPNCAEAGVLGVLPGIIGSMQAAEVIKLIAGLGKPLIGRLLLLDATDFSTQLIGLPKGRSPEVKALIDYAAWCGYPDVPALEPEEARTWADEHSAQWLDVREPEERAVRHLGGVHIPLGELPDRLSELDPKRPTLVYCQSGRRSAEAVRLLQTDFHFRKVFHLKGGLQAWQAAELSR